MYYHLSEDKNLKCLTPRVPRYAVKGMENTSIKRICCSSDFEKCVPATYPVTGEVLYVYECLVDENTKILNPSQILKYVSDAEFTDEHWIVDETISVKLIGKIKIIEGGYEIQTKNSLGKKCMKNVNLKYKWINN